MKTLRQEDGRRLGMTSRKWIYTYACNKRPTGWYVSLNMCQLYRAAQQFLTVQDTWTQRGSNSHVLLCLYIQTLRVMPLNRQQTVVQKGPLSRVSMYLFIQLSSTDAITRNAGWKWRTTCIHLFSVLVSTKASWVYNFNLVLLALTEMCPCHGLWNLPSTKSWQRICS